MEQSERRHNARCLDRLKLVKVRMGLSWRQVAERAGMSERTVMSWVQRGTEPKIDAVLAIAQGLELDPCWLAFGVRTDPDSDPDLARVLDYLRVHPEQLEALENLLGALGPRDQLRDH